MLSPQTIQIVKATAPVVAEHAEAITRQFYSLMFAGNPEVQKYFNQAHQHSGGQQRALAGAICAYADNIDNLGALGLAVELIAQKHCSLGIQPEHYPIVGKHLLAAIKDILGDAATENIVSAWAEAYGFLAEIFMEREKTIYEAQRTVPGGWNGYRRFAVKRKSQENELVTSFYLAPADGGELASFKPGQYITVTTNQSKTPMSPRNYSLSDRPGTGYYRISVKREAGLTADLPIGLFSNFLHDEINEGDVLNIGPPCGDFTLDLIEVADRLIVLLSGGIGITPLMSMLKSLAYQRVKAPVFFVHAARNGRFHAFADEIRRVASECANVTTHVRYNAPRAEDLDRRCCDSTGIVDVALLQKLLPSRDAEFYLCGPKPFMSALYLGLKDWGVPESQIHFEFFGPKEDVTRDWIAYQPPFRSIDEP